MAASGVAQGVTTDPKRSNKGRIILLNGPPSSGKSTLAAALQGLLEEPYYHRSLDDFRRGYPDRYWLADDGTLFRRVLQGYLLSLHAMASVGHNIIAEAVITPDRLERYLTLFTDFPVLFVGVRCPLEEAQRREQERGDRLKGPINLAALGFDLVHAHGPYDLEIDTFHSTPAEAARRIKEVLAAPPIPTAFERLRAQSGSSPGWSSARSAS